MADQSIKPEHVETETVERPKSNMLGKMLNRLRGERTMAVETVKHKMLEHYKVGFKDRGKYKFVEDRVTLPSGKEVVELRLYKLIDGATITLDVGITSDIEAGISNLKEFRPHGKTED